MTAADAFRLLQAGDADGALAASRRRLQAEPRDARAHLAAGIALRLLGRPGESLAAIEAAARLAPADFGCAYECGVALSLQGRDEEALPWFRRALALRPGFAPAHYAIGMAAFARGDWPAAVRELEIAARDPANPAAAINWGLALAEAGDAARADAVLREAVARHPQVPEARHALGWTLVKARRAKEAIPFLEAALAARDDPAWRVDLAKALADRRRDDEARAHYEAAVAAAPKDADARVAYGRFCVARGDFQRAAAVYGEALSLRPGDGQLSMYVAQVALALGRWREGWSAYAGREPRRLFARERAAAGGAYAPPTLQALTGRLVVLRGEQGLGDELFFLRFAPALGAAGTRLVYQGDARLRSLVARAGLFESVLDAGEEAPPDGEVLLVGDLPLVLGSTSTPPSIHIPPDTDRIAAMRRRLERLGPRPWIGVTWRSGTAPDVVAHALSKNAPIAGLCAALPREGTVLSLQRGGGFEELEAASRALGRPVFDVSDTAADLEDTLALVALLDRHVGVSSTNMHLAAAAGATADVLVPFPPEWRWGLAGDSPWFPGFRVYRQAPGGDWSRAFAALAATASAGSTSPA